jgi:predicted RND superfamily exporter protein
MRKFFKHPWIIVVIITAITVFFALQLPRAEIDNNNMRFVPDDDPALEVSRYIDDTFGSSFFILVGLERQYGTVFEARFLNRIRDYISRIEEISIVENVSSLINTDYITSEGDAIVVEKLMPDDFSGSPEEIEELKRRVLSWDMYERALISDDLSATQILIPLSISSEDSGRPEVVDDFILIRDIAREMFADFATVYVTGMPIIAATVNEAVNADLLLLVPLVILVVIAILFFSFRRLSAVLLPLLTVLVATIWSIGAMPLFGVKLSVITTVLPVILIAVGSAYGIHVVSHFMSDRGSRIFSPEEHREFVFELLGKIGKPVFLAALTTFVAFVSFCFTTVVPIREFGYFSSFGVFASFIVAISLIPSLLIIRGPNVMRGKKAGQGKDEDENRLSILIADTLVTIARKKRFIVSLTVVVLVFSLYGFSKIIIDNVMVEYFKSTTDIYKSDVFIRQKFGGSKVVSVVLEAESPEILLHPDTLSAMDGLARYLVEKVPKTGKVMGFTDLIKRINQVFNADESPEGIKPSAPLDSGDSFGFSGDSGFGDFGFDDFGFGDFDEAPAPAAAAASTSAGDSPGAKTYTGEDLAALFDRAGSRSRTMDTADLVWELKRQINYQGAAYYEIPNDPKRYGKESPEELQRLISNYLVLLSGNISDYANDPLEPTAIKSTIQMRTVGMYDSEEIFREIDNYIASNFPPNIQVTIGGTTMVEDSLNDLVVQSQLISVIISIVLVFIIVAASNRSLIAGCIGITPLSLSVLINFAVMGFAGIKLNLGTSMVASVSVGVGIDYTIHYLEAYKREFRALGGQGDFLRRTFMSSGKAIIINAISVGAGFSVLRFSSFNMLADLGLLIALTMLSSAFVSLTVLPVLLGLFKPSFIAETPRAGNPRKTN